MPRPGSFWWSRLSDRRLLQLRIRDLNLRLQDSWLMRPLAQLRDELSARGIRFSPHAWLSDEWFTPDGVPGVAIPFYLAHPRLMRLEQTQMLQVEGGTHDWCMRILRHEAGHAIDNAYRLHRRKGYRKLFGRYQQPYPDSYRPRPNTKRFVIHLDMGYAQAHPAEDFAETFAVWLNRQSNWKEQYATWPALAKLQYIDELMPQIASAAPAVRTRRRPHSLSTLRQTLDEHYRKRRACNSSGSPTVYDRDLRRIFSDHAEHARSPRADRFLEVLRPQLLLLVSRWTGASPLTIEAAIADMIQRVSRLELRLRQSPGLTRTDVLMMLAVQTMNFVHDRRHRVFL